MRSSTPFLFAASLALASGSAYVVAHAQVLTYSKGQPISAAASRARQEACKAGDGTWLAYAVYANPQAHLLTSGPAAPGGGV